MRDTAPAILACMPPLPTLYKARGMALKQRVCAICVDRTRGRTRRVVLGYGVSVWLCPGHADEGFLTRRSGRDLVTTLLGIWQANGCLTAARSKALDAHIRAVQGAASRERPRPGSYAWPELRREAERRFARGVPLAAAIGQLVAGLHVGAGAARPPSTRTFARWRAERRWLAAARAP